MPGARKDRPGLGAPRAGLNVTRNNGSGLTQLAELELWADDAVVPAAGKR